MQLSETLEPCFSKLNNGKLIRSVVATVLRIGAVLGAVVGVVYSIMIVGGAFRTNEFGAVVAHLLMAACYLTLVACGTAIALYRAGTVDALQDSRHTVIPIVSILFRAAGEASLTSFSLLGVGGCLFIWLSNMDPMNELGPLGSILPQLGSAAGSLGGIAFLGGMVTLAFCLMLWFYFIAEAILVGVEIAANTAGLIQIPLGGAAAAIAASAEVSHRQASAPIPATANCRRCGERLDPGAGFCGGCGGPA